VDPRTFITFAEEVLKRLFGDNLPSGVVDALAILLLLLLVLLIPYSLILAAGRIVKTIRDDIRPGFYDEKARDRRRRRRLFARHLSWELDILAKAEHWLDHQYAELEAEVESEGRRSGLLSFLRFGRELRRERSLSSSLRNTRERLVLLEGTPGSGKSVALRHLAAMLTRDAMKARSTAVVIPIYVNLKRLERAADEAIDAALIRAYVLRTLNRGRDQELDKYLADEFHRGMEEGTWLFLLDSFDEIPEVLSATSARSTVRDYSNAIAAFLGGLNRCRAVVASRHFHGPGEMAWPRFLILPLSNQRRRALIRHAELDADATSAIIAGVEREGPELGEMTRVPLFLALLCEFMRKGTPFPDTAHAVYESFVSTRLGSDEERLRLRFGVDPTVVRAAAEHAAFTMASEGMGLSPSREQLAQAMVRTGFPGDVETMLDAVAFTRLVRTDEQDGIFTFMHRRLQEYFATCVVLREPERVSPDKLLTDARWRETAVTFLQVQENVTNLLAAAEKRLRSQGRAIEAQVPEGPSLEGNKTSEELRPTIQLEWPDLTLHLLALLQDGFRGRPEKLPETFRALVGQIVLAVTWNGSMADRRWVLEVAGAAPQPVLTFALRDAYANGSSWLGDAAFRQIGSLRSIDDELAKAVRRAVIARAVFGRLYLERHAAAAHLARMAESQSFLDGFRLLLFARTVDIGAHAVIAVALALAAQPVRGVLLMIAVMLTPRIGRWMRTISPVNPLDAALGVFVVSLGLRMLIADSAGPYVAWTTVWVSMAVMAAAIGQFTRCRWWPVLHLLPLLYLIRNASHVPDGIRKLRSFLRKYWFTIAFMILYLSSMGAFAWAMNEKRRRAPAAIALLVVLGVVFISVCWDGIRFVRDHMKLLFLRFRKIPWTADDVVREVDGLWRPQTRTRFIRRIRERSLLPPAEESERAIRCSALALERAHRAGKYKRSLFETLFRGRQRRRAILEVALLDELNQLVEQLRQQRPSP
jgi:hypothetical protein